MDETSSFLWFQVKVRVTYNASIHHLYIMSGIWGNFASSMARYTAQTKMAELEPHKALSEVLNDLPDRSSLRFRMSSRGTLLRYLFNTIYGNPDWLPYFLPDNEPYPTFSEAEDWAWMEEFSGEAFYCLSETQRRIDRQRMARREPLLRGPRPGSICGKSFNRYARTYTCK